MITEMRQLKPMIEAELEQFGPPFKLKYLMIYGDFRHGDLCSLYLPREDGMN